MTIEERNNLSFNLRLIEGEVRQGLAELVTQKVVQRIWKHDHTVWKEDLSEIDNRLGWLNTVEEMQKRQPEILDFVDSVRDDGYTHGLLLGMGGSSLAPDVFRNTFGVGEDHLDFAIIDSTDPDVIESHASRIAPEKSLFIVSTKSGSTVETLSLFKYFYNLTADSIGLENTGSHFIAITDPGSQLEDLAKRLSFRKTFLNDSNIGGRYSALSFFGLVPAALMGLDISLLLDRAKVVMSQSRRENTTWDGENEAALLGVILGEAAKVDRDKLSFILSPSIQSFGLWLEQLIAESTGKEGKGILPVISEPLGPPEVYGDDRLFVYIRLVGDETHDEAVNILQSSGQPLIHLALSDLYDLGAQIFLWEMAVAIAGHRMKIHPFNQPDVESAKVRAWEMVAAYRKSGDLPVDEPAKLNGDTWKSFILQAHPRDYIAIQAYITPTDRMDAVFRILRTRLQDNYCLATTVGYGPRFLHSTGQLHKGDQGNGLFIQLTDDHARDIPIPDDAGSPESTMTFGTLKMAQALGDKQALLDRGRRIIRFHLGDDPEQDLKHLIRDLE